MGFAKMKVKERTHKEPILATVETSQQMHYLTMFLFLTAKVRICILGVGLPNFEFVLMLHNNRSDD